MQIRGRVNQVQKDGELAVVHQLLYYQQIMMDNDGKDSPEMKSPESYQLELERPPEGPRIEGFKEIFTPSTVSTLYPSPKGRYAFTEFMSNYFVKLGVKEKIDNNELNIIADFHYYNTCFAIEQLLLPYEKTALLLNIFAMLIAFRDFETSGLIIKTYTERSQEAPKSEEEDYKLALGQKYDFFRDALLSYSIDNPPLQIRIFTADEVKKILDYAMDTYFPHFRLYSYVLSNKQLSDQKTIEVYIDEPLPIPPLCEGLVANPEREEVDSKEEEDFSESLTDEKENGIKETENKEEKAAEPTEVKKPEIGRKPPKLKKETENIINNKVEQFKNEVQEKINEREKALEKVIEEIRGTVAKKAQSLYIYLRNMNQSARLIEAIHKIIKSRLRDLRCQSQLFFEPQQLLIKPFIWPNTWPAFSQMRHTLMQPLILNRHQIRQYYCATPRHSSRASSSNLIKEVYQ
eukprot:TRINITY_DN506_c0_g1_i9.p4 TRINITY_DN506_c0_g1~~TRINITY_DN506_c0_g1_i9.p4  ORF type:complete len:461 (+),score=52.30 TRINITY_DN506_c0_g1_i9:39-1421(+)